MISARYDKAPDEVAWSILQVNGRGMEKASVQQIYTNRCEGIFCSQEVERTRSASKVPSMASRKFLTRTTLEEKCIAGANAI